MNRFLFAVSLASVAAISAGCCSRPSFENSRFIGSWEREGQPGTLDIRKHGTFVWRAADGKQFIPGEWRQAAQDRALFNTEHPASESDPALIGVLVTDDLLALKANEAPLHRVK